MVGADGGASRRAGHEQPPLGMSTYIITTSTMWILKSSSRSFEFLHKVDIREIQVVVSFFRLLPSLLRYSALSLSSQDEIHPDPARSDTRRLYFFSDSQHPYPGW